MAVSPASRVGVGLAALLASLAPTLAPQPARAQEDWTGASSSDWNDGGNWTDGSVPDGSQDVNIDGTLPNPAVIGAGAPASAQNVYIGLLGSGALAISAGGSLAVGGGGGEVGLAAVPGAVGRLYIGALSDSAADAVAPGTLGAGSVAFGSGDGRLIFNHTDTAYGFAASIGPGTPGAVGSVTVLSGTTGLSGTNTYTGETRVLGGRLVAGANAAFSDASDFTVGAGAVLEVADGIGTTLGSLSGAGGVVVGSGSSLSVLGSGARTFSGSITGDGLFDYEGSGTLRLTGSSHIGDTLGVCTCATGVLDIDGGSFVADSLVQVIGGTLRVSNGGTLETLDVEADSDVIVTGAGSRLTASGITEIGFIGAGAVTVSDGGLLESQDGALINFLGFFPGTPSVTVTGTGSRWTVTGTLDVGSTLAGALGALTVADGGRVSTSDTTTIAAGSTLALGTGGLAGALDTPAIANEGAITADFTDTLTLAADVSGTGTLTKRGSGTLILTGSSTPTGTTTIEAGRLLVNGSLSGPLALAAGGTLGGSGRVGGFTSNGTLAPGNSVGTLTVAGNLTLEPGSSYEVEVDPWGTASDLIHVTGTATVNGGRVLHVGPDERYRGIARYTILSADGGLSGRFDGVSSSFAFLDAALDYDDRNAYLTLTRNDTPFQAVAETRNQRSTAAGLESLGPTAPLYQAIEPLSESQARNAFDLLSGEPHLDLGASRIQYSRTIRDIAAARLRQAFLQPGAPLQFAQAGVGDLPHAAPAPATPAPATKAAPTAWAQTYGAIGRRDGDGNAASADHTLAGALLGADAPLGEHWRLGLFTGYDRGRIEVADRSASLTVDSLHLGAYGGGDFGPLGLAFGATYSWHSVDSSRTVAFPGFAEELEAEYGATTTQLFGEVSWDLPVEAVALQPFAGLAWIRSAGDSFHETGGEAALTVSPDDYAVPYSTLGLRAAAELALDGLPTVTALGALGWQHAYGELVPAGTARFAGGDSFSIRGLPVARDTAVFRAGLSSALAGEAARVGVTYEGEAGAGFQEHGLSLELSLRF